MTNLQGAVPEPLARVVYISRARTGSRKADVTSLLVQCGRNNPVEGLSGLLLADPTSYLQALRARSRRWRRGWP